MLFKRSVRALSLSISLSRARALAFSLSLVLSFFLCICLSLSLSLYVPPRRAGASRFGSITRVTPRYSRRTDDESRTRGLKDSPDTAAVDFGESRIHAFATTRKEGGRMGREGRRSKPPNNNISSIKRSERFHTRKLRARNN